MYPTKIYGDIVISKPATKKTIIYNFWLKILAFKNRTSHDMFIKHSCTAYYMLDMLQSDISRYNVTVCLAATIIVDLPIVAN